MIVMLWRTHSRYFRRFGLDDTTTVWLNSILLFLVLLLFLRRKPWAGRATGLFLALYALGTFVIEFWRGDDAARGMVIEGYISTSQLLSIPIFFAGVAIFLIRKRPDDA